MLINEAWRDLIHWRTMLTFWILQRSVTGRSVVALPGEIIEAATNGSLDLEEG